MNLEFNKDKHEYSIDGKIIPSVTQILSAVGLSDFSCVSPDILQVACERGTIVHQYVEWHNLGVLDEESVDPELRGYFDAYLSAGIPKPVSSEKIVYSKTFNYAGTLDQLVTPRWINEIKTTAQQSPVHGLQLTAYWLAEHDINDKPDKLTALYLKPDGTSGLVEYQYEPLVWLSILSICNWKRKNNLTQKGN